MHRIVRLVCGAAALAGADGYAQQLPAHVRVVNAGAAPGGDGNSWAAAYNKLQTALGAASGSGGQITELWVAQGEYHPSLNGQCAPFVVSNVSLYGGFAGFESSRQQRPPGARSTIRDAAGSCTSAAPGLVEVNTTNPVVIDGFAITLYFTTAVLIEGPATLSRVSISGGAVAAALRKLGTGELTLRNCSIDASSSTGGTTVELVGPGLMSHCDVSARQLMSTAVRLAGMTVEDCAIDADGDSAGIWADNTTFERCLIQARANAGPIGLAGDDLHVRDCTITTHAYQPFWFGNGGTIVRSRLAGVGDNVDSTGMRLDGTQVVDSLIEISAVHRYVDLLAAPIVVNTRFRGHSFQRGFTGATASPHFINCLFEQGPTYNYAPTWRAFEVGPGWRFDNCIISHRPPEEPTGFPLYPPQLTFSTPPGLTGFINHSIVRGWTGQYGGMGNSGADPLLNPDGRCRQDRRRSMRGATRRFRRGSRTTWPATAGSWMGT